MQEQKTSHLGKMFIGTFILLIILSSIVFSIFGFEIALIFTLCFSVATMTTAVVGLENIIILKNK